MKRGVLAAVAAVLAIPAAASADVLYDQTTGTQGLTVPSSHRSAPAPSDADAADDFIVPLGMIWNPTSVDVMGQAVGGQTGNVVLFADSAGQPGVELFRQVGIPFPAGSAQTLPLSGVPPLPPGHYWLSVYTSSTSSRWMWRLESPTTSYPAVWENPPNGDGTGCATFRPLTDCGFGAADGTDLVFRLNGTAAAIVRRRWSRCRRHRSHQRAASARKRRCKKRHR